MGGGARDFEQEPDRDYALQEKEKALQKAKEDAENAARAQRQAQDRERQAKEQEKRAREAQERAEEARQIARMRAEEVERQAKEAQRKAEENQRKAEAEAKQAEKRAEEAQKKAMAERQEAEEARRKMQADMTAAAEKAKQERQIIEAQAADAKRQAAEAMQRAEEDAARARTALDQAQKERQKREAEVREAAAEREKLKSLIESLSAGIEPEFVPTEKERADAEQRFQYKKENIHFAVAGSTGTGKSSLINAFRRLRDTDKGAAKVDIAEATLETKRYPDPDPKLPRRRFVWYDIPGSDGVEIDAWEYFKKQQLFVFDVVLVVFSERFRGSDIVLLRHCERLDIPTFVVRTKSDLAIESIQKKLFEAAMKLHGPPEDEDDADEDDAEDHDEDDNKSNWHVVSRSPADYYQAAREQYISTASENVRAALEKERLPKKPVYLVTNEGIRLVSTYLGKKPISLLKGWQNKQQAEKLLDEEKLVRDMLQAAYNRRYSAKTPATTDVSSPGDESGAKTGNAREASIPSSEHSGGGESSGGGIHQ
jgi:hypothetical protein